MGEPPVASGGGERHGQGRTWRIIVSPRAEKDLRRLPDSLVERIRIGIDGLVPWPGRGDYRRLVGMPEWRLRVGEWRVRFAVDADASAVVILRVLPRGRAYRDQ